MLRINEILKLKGKSRKWLINQLGISYQALTSRENNPTHNSIIEISNALDCEIHELFNTSSDYSHFYDNNTGEWLGIRKK